MKYIKEHPIDLLLIALPLVLVLRAMNASAIVIFIVSAVGLIPLAGLIGRSTEALAVYTGPKIGGLLNATLGNAAELIITIIAIKEGLLELVKASITGSVLGNLLLVLGMAMLLGGFKHGVQVFDKRQAMTNAILMIISVIALLIPSVFSHTIGAETSMKVEALSLGVAAMMILLYVFGLIYSFRHNQPAGVVPETVPHTPEWSKKVSLVVLGLATVGVVIMSEILVGEVEHVTKAFGLSEFFIGVILIPIVGNVAEHLVAVQVATRNKMDLSVEIAVSSSLQIALFVAPILVFISLLMGNPMNLIFNQFELIAIGCAIIITAMVSADGESNWLEGLSLVAVYILLGLAFFLMPA